MNCRMLIEDFARATAWLVLAVALSLGAAEAGERDLALVEPAAVGMSAEGLDELGAAMQGFVDRGQLAGVVTVDEPLHGGT